MSRIIIFGNSGAGKSTLAKKLSSQLNLSHFDLDSIAWLPTDPPSRMPVAQSWSKIELFIKNNDRWVIEGCYADLLQLIVPHCTEMRFINIGVEACVNNARNRPWEPHKYSSKEAQDKSLGMLVEWIRHYPNRTDEFSLKAHRKLFDSFGGTKQEYTRREDLP